MESKSPLLPKEIVEALGVQATRISNVSCPDEDATRRIVTTCDMDTYEFLQAPDGYWLPVVGTLEQQVGVVPPGSVVVVDIESGDFWGVMPDGTHASIDCELLFAKDVMKMREA